MAKQTATQKLPVLCTPHSRRPYRERRPTLKKEAAELLEQIEEKRSILRRVMSSNLPISVKDTKVGRALLELGITQVYIREMTVNGRGSYTFLVNPDPVSNLKPSYQITDEDLDLEPLREGGAARGSTS